MGKVSKTTTNRIVKICLVCGDSASGINYNAMTCVSCRIFFQRNHHNPYNWKCQFESNCSINQYNRRCCPRCRLEKCFRIGMCFKTTTKAVNNKNGIGLLSTINSSFTLYPFELERIQFVQRTINSYFVDERRLQSIGQLEILQGAHLFPLYARKVVKFCKSFPEFTILNGSEQLILLKSFLPSIMPIRMSFHWNRETETIPVIINESSDAAIAVRYHTSLQLRNRELIYENKLIIDKLNLAMKNDSIIRDLLIAQMLFKPQNGETELSEQTNEYVRHQRNLYCHLLQKYLLLKYECDSEMKFQNLIQMINDSVREIQKNVRLIVTELDFYQLPQILIEVFDLKPEQFVSFNAKLVHDSIL
ncbi:hypothetical protein RDWZM_000142 [Blomia tropicalis]|uniref:Uncharacterized protein n=1 Tax=Blomia tropicalis TaxID=40697 RepID=A0A9Q0MCA5_BLOTA|nr:hypothetical protein RDWZM_000142 [Blomia tropicalis]